MVDSLVILTNIITLLLLVIVIVYGKRYIDNNLQNYINKIDDVTNHENDRREKVNEFINNIVKKYNDIQHDFNNEMVYRHHAADEIWNVLNAEVKKIKEQQAEENNRLQSELSKVRNMLAKCKKTKKEASWK